MVPGTGVHVWTLCGDRASRHSPTARSSACKYIMAMTLAANDDHEADESSTLMLPTLEDQQRENKAWQDVFDTPATKQAESPICTFPRRRAAVGLAGRIESVEKLKEEAKTSFKDSKYGLALRSYCMCIWHLRLDDPPC